MIMKDRTFIRKMDGVKAILMEIKYRDGSKVYRITWNTYAIDDVDYKTLNGAEKFLVKKGYEEA